VVDESFDAYSRVAKLLTVKSSYFTKESRVSGFDLLFGEDDKNLTLASFRIAFLWLLAVSAWQGNIQAFDRYLEKLSNNAMSTPSLKTFRPIPTLRQNIADLRDGIQLSKDRIGEADGAAFRDLQGVTTHRLEPLDSVFETLLQRTSALSAKASNEIQLVIGSVTIQVSFSQ
jgi:hypothetical protein